MRKFVVVFVTLVMMEVALGIVCPPNYCERVDCGKFPTEENCEGILVPNSSFCSCCNTCTHHVDEGEECTTELLFLARGMLPLDHSYVCKSGTFCRRGICIAPTVQILENSI